MNPEDILPISFDPSLKATNIRPMNQLNHHHQTLLTTSSILNFAGSSSAQKEDKSKVKMQSLLAHNQRQNELDTAQMLNAVKIFLGDGRFITKRPLTGSHIYEMELLEVNKNVFPQFISDLENMVSIKRFSFTENPFVGYIEFNANQNSNIDQFIQHFTATYPGLFDDIYWKYFEILSRKNQIHVSPNSKSSAIQAPPQFPFDYHLQYPEDQPPPPPTKPSAYASTFIPKKRRNKRSKTKGLKSLVTYENQLCN